jgi:hypothetical protein
MGNGFRGNPWAILTGFELAGGIVDGEDGVARDVCVVEALEETAD